MEKNINISLLERENDSISGVRIDGVIDTITASELEHVIESLIKRGKYKIILDLAGVDYISSAGWGIFISHIKEVRSKGGDIKLASMIENVYEIYELLEFENVLKSYNSTDDARSDFEGVSNNPTGKKKDQKNSQVKIIDQIANQSHSAIHKENSFFSENSSDPVTFVLRQVKDDPFISISEIKAYHKRAGNSSDPLGWWDIFIILKRQKLLTKRSRFRFARQYYRS